MHPKIESKHLERKACLYLRQSTPKQLLEHKESARVQLQLKEKLHELGFNDVEVIETDLGKSGSGYVKREGFLKLLNEVCENRVGAVAAWEASRLARNNFEWQNLIRYCQITETLLIDEGGVYDPCNMDDLVMLGIKGTICEYELRIIMKRARAGLLEKARRGELFTKIPVGYHLNEAGKLEKYPNERVQKSIKLIFDKFEELGSARQVLLWFLDNKVDIPKIRYYNKKRSHIFEAPLYGSILEILNNPCYAGAYAYGQSKAKEYIRDNEPVKTKGHRVPMDCWDVLLNDHHKGYISWDRYLNNRHQLKQNSQLIPQTNGAAKMGCGLISGLLDCGFCGRKLRVRYSGRDHKSVSYYCCGDSKQKGENQGCFTLPGKKIEALIVEQVLKVIQPAAIDASIEAEKRLSEQNSDLIKMRELDLEQARYESNLRKRQFESVDPEKHFVTREIQQEWDKALAEVEFLEQALEKEKSSLKSFDSIDTEYLYGLANDLPRLWHLPTTDDRSKKRIIRKVIKKITVSLDTDGDRLRFVIYWSGGVHSEIIVKHYRPNRQTSKDALEILKDLALTLDDGAIARILNRCGLQTGSGKNWNKPRVRAIRKVYGIANLSQDNKENSNIINLEQAAKQLHVSDKIVAKFIKAGLITAKQIVKYAPWQIDKSELNKESVLKAVELLKKTGKTNIQLNQQELDLQKM